MKATHDDARGADERRQSTWTWVIPVSLLVVLVGLYFVWPNFQEFIDGGYSAIASGQQERVEEWVSGFGAWSFAVVIALMLMQTVFAFLPSLLIMVVSVLAFGPVVGGFLAWGGLLIAACLGYGIGFAVGPVTVDRIIGEKTERKVTDLVDRYGVWAVVAARISPMLSTDAVSIIAGLARMRFIPFLIATAAGTLPLTVLVAWLGAEIQRLKTGLVWVGIISLAAFIGYVLYDRYGKKSD